MVMIKVDVDMSDFETEDLQSELTRRGEHEIDLEEFETEELIDELEIRMAQSVQLFEPDFRSIYNALRLGDERKALDIIRPMVCDALGVIL